MRAFFILAALLLSLNLFGLPSNISAQDASPLPQADVVDVYAVFWPIVPGKTVADSMFWAKQAKEIIGGMFTFGTINKAEHHIELSEKRIVETNKLIEDKNFGNVSKSLGLNGDQRKKALEFKKRAAEEKLETLELTNKLVKSLENQEKALVYFSSKLPEEQKKVADEALKELSLQISEAK